MQEERPSKSLEKSLFQVNIDFFLAALDENHAWREILRLLHQRLDAEDHALLQKIRPPSKRITRILANHDEDTLNHWLKDRLAEKGSWADLCQFKDPGVGVYILPHALGVEPVVQIVATPKETRRREILLGWAESMPMVGIIEESPSLTYYLDERIEKLQEELNSLTDHETKIKNKGKHRELTTPEAQVLGIMLKALHERRNMLLKQYPHLADKRQYCCYVSGTKRCGQFVAWTPKTIGSKYCRMHLAPASRQRRNKKYYDKDPVSSRRQHRRYKRRDKLSRPKIR